MVHTSIQKYLPSSQFALLVGALAISAGFVFAADAFTKPKTVGAVVAGASNSASPANTNWEATLYDIQAQQGVGSLPEAPDAKAVSALQEAAKTGNLTDSVGRTLLVNLTTAKAQGLGDDIPTQNQLVAEAAQQLKQNNKQTYALSDLLVVTNASSTLHSYANNVILVLVKNSKDNKVYQTLQAVALALDNQDPKQLTKLKSIEGEYRSLVKDLLALPVPQTLAPFHLAVVNDFERIADTYPNIESIETDPLRGLVALQQYQTLGDEVDRMFINIAQSIGKSGILFTKGEPGSAWSALLSLQ